MKFDVGFEHDSVNECIIFAAHEGKTRIRNTISEEALEDNFEAKELGVAEAFHKNRHEIQKLAEEAFAEGQLNAGGGAAITALWLSARGYQRP